MKKWFINKYVDYLYGKCVKLREEASGLEQLGGDPNRVSLLNAKSDEYEWRAWLLQDKYLL